MRPDEDAARHALIALGLPPAAELTLVEAGHINQSYRVDLGGAPRLLLQWLNHDVFAAADAVQANVERVLAHLHAAGPGSPRLASADDGALHVRTDTGLWRAFHWLADRTTLSRPGGPPDAAGAGEALGRALGLLSDMPVAALRPAMAGFHDPELRLAALDAAVVDATPGRLAAAAGWLDLIGAQRNQQSRVLASSGAHRVLHGDPKFSNFMFAEDSAAVPVVLVDWDTVMVGPLAWDFGDFLRSAAARGNEDDPACTGVDADLLLAATDGFLIGLGQQMHESTARALASAPAHMAFMLAVRFLTDFLAGDRYFRISRPEQNLDRAATQFALVAAFAEAEAMLERRLMASNEGIAREHS